ncbi:MAG: hypothetical protein MI974_29290 [Chitinophagales bacterium]|nr:hypothetical protein [Chitinophagales bacterium]
MRFIFLIYAILILSPCLSIGQTYLGCSIGAYYSPFHVEVDDSYVEVVSNNTSVFYGLRGQTYLSSNLFLAVAGEFSRQRLERGLSGIVYSTLKGNYTRSSFFVTANHKIVEDLYIGIGLNYMLLNRNDSSRLRLDEKQILNGVSALSYQLPHFVFEFKYMPAIKVFQDDEDYYRIDTPLSTLSLSVSYLFRILRQ